MLTAVAIIFIVAGPFLLVASRLDIPAAPLLIVAGIVSGFVIDEEVALELARFGIALLVFSFGVGIQLTAIRTVLADSELAAIGQIGIVGSLGVGFGVILGVPLAESLYLGVAAALSSTIVGTALFEREIRRNHVHGRLAESIQLVQDLVAIVFILIVGAGVFEADPIATQIGYGVFFVLGAVLFNRYLFRFMEILAGDSDELMIVGVVSVLVVFIGAADLADVSIVVGAFAAGLAVRYEPAQFLGLYNGLDSIKDFFVAVFFVTVGALVVIPFVEIGTTESVEKLLLVAGLILLTVVLKPIVTTAILIYRGYESRSAMLTGLNTGQVSEFSLIIAIEALLLGFLTQSVFDAIILAAALTMILSAVIQRKNEGIYRALSARNLVLHRHSQIDEKSQVPVELADHVIILGYGDEGKRLIDTCERVGQPYVVIENDPLLRDQIKFESDAYVFGDAMEAYTWEKANVDSARVIVSVTESPAVSRRLLEFDFSPPVILSASDERSALTLLENGASYVTVPDLLAGEQLINHIRELLEDEISPTELRRRGLKELEDDPQRRAP